MRRVDRDPIAAIELLTEKVGGLQSVCDRLTHENEDLRAALRSLSPATSATTDDGSQRGIALPSTTKLQRRSTGASRTRADTTTDNTLSSVGERPVSRRGMLATAVGMAAAAAGASVVAEGLADPAAATTGADLVLGLANDAESPTTVSYDGTTGGLSGSVMFLANDTPDPANAASYPAALGGWAGAPGSPAGVANGIYGFTENGTGNAVVAINGATTGTGGGVFATSDSGSAEATAVLGIMTSTNPRKLLLGAARTEQRHRRLGYRSVGIPGRIGLGRVRRECGRCRRAREWRYRHWRRCEWRLRCYRRRQCRPASP